MQAEPACCPGRAHAGCQAGCKGARSIRLRADGSLLCCSVACRFELLCAMEPLMVGGSTTGEIHFGAHSDVPPPLR